MERKITLFFFSVLLAVSIIFVSSTYKDTTTQAKKYLHILKSQVHCLISEIYGSDPRDVTGNPHSIRKRMRNSLNQRHHSSPYYTVLLFIKGSNTFNPKKNSTFSNRQNKNKKHTESTAKNPEVLLRMNINKVVLKEFLQFKHKVDPEKGIKLTFIDKVMAAVIIVALIFFKINFKSTDSTSILVLGLTFTSILTVQAYQDISTGFNGNPIGSLTRKIHDVITGKVSGFIIAGLNADNMACSKVNNDVSIAWEYFSTCAGSCAYGISYGSDDGYIITGQRAFGCSGGTGPYVHKISESGANVWQVDIATIGMAAYGIKTLSSGNYAVVGYNPSGVGFLSKVSPAGAHLSTTNPCSTACFLRDVTELPNSDLSVAGYRTDITWCYWALIPSSGGTITERNFGYAGYISRCYGITALSDGTVALAGTTNGGGSLNHGSYDVWAFKLATDGTKLWEYEYGDGNSEEAARIRVMTSKHLMISAIRFPQTALVYIINNAGIIDFEYPREHSSYYYGEFGGCAYVPLYGFASVVTLYYVGSDIDAIFFVKQACPDGYYVSGSSCLACSAGYYQDLIQQTSCKDCPAGTFGNVTNLSNCTACSEGFYSLARSTSCSVCNADWYPAATRDKCLYKGMFNTIADFTANTFSTTCYSSGVIAKPFTQACRTAYHSLCCQGSTRLTTLNCNLGLNFTYGDTMFNTYCSACPFMNQALCPANGVCWNDSTWTDNSVSPYSVSYSTNCLQSIKSFCVPQLLANESDAQCSVFSNICVTNVSKVEYGTRWDIFRITFKKGILPVQTDCSTIFSAANSRIDLRNIICTVINSTVLDVNVSALSAPLINFSFTNATVSDLCNYTIPATLLWNITPPQLETVKIDSNISNKCLGFTYKLNITKPYSWNIVRVRWNVSYVNTAGLSSEVLTYLASVGQNNESELFIHENYLLAERILKVTVEVITPYNTTVWAYTQVYIQNPIQGRNYCGPCQLKDRSKCVQYDGICWTTWSDYLVPYPTIAQKCLKAIAPECYRLWKTLGEPGQECADYNFNYTYPLMAIKPGLVSVNYSTDAKFIMVNFNTSINNDSFVECSEILSDESLNWLPGPRTGIWMSKSALYIFYDPAIGIMPSITFKSNSVFYDYMYSQEPMNATTFQIGLPKPNVQLEITAPQIISECETLIINVVNTVSTLYVLNFRWEIKFSTVDPQMDKASLEDGNFYFKQFANKSRSRLVSIPNRYLSKGCVISAKVEALNEGDGTVLGNASISVKVVENFPKIKFTAKNQRALNIESDDTEVIAIQTDNNKCQKASSTTSSDSVIPAEISFKVYSKDDTNITVTSGNYEGALSDTLNKMFKESKQLVLSSGQGFEYYQYYLLIAQMRDSDSGNAANDSLIIQFTKPLVESVVDSGGTLLSVDDNVELSGERSSFPEAGTSTSDSGNLRASSNSKNKDEIIHKWKCIKAVPLTSLVNCECPVFDMFSAGKPKLSIHRNKFAPLCTYTFGLGVSAKGKTFTRTAYNETEFTKYKGAAIQVRGKLMKGSQKDGKDIYLTFEMNTTDKVGDIKYEWELIEVKSLNPYSPIMKSQKKTFMAKFFKTSNPETKIDVNDDKEIPESDRPKFITPLNRRIIGFNKDTLRSNYQYLFAVKAYFSKTPTFLYVKLLTPPSPRKRIVNVIPPSGIGLMTSFTITYALETSTEIDQAEYQIFRRDCPSSDEGSASPITRTMLASSSFTTILAAGKKSCDYQVEIIVRIKEYDDFIDCSFPSLTIKEPDQPKDEVMKMVVDSVTNENRTSTVDEKLSILTQVTVMTITEVSTVAEECVEKIMTFVNKTDSDNSTTMSSLNDDNKVQMLNSTANIMSNVINNNAPNVSVANSIKDKVDDYLNAVKDKNSGSDILSTCLNTLSGAANVGTEKEQNNTYFSSMQKSLSTMSVMKLDELQPGAPSYNMSSPAIEMSTKKNYADEFNSSQEFASDNGTQANLPPGIGDTLLSKISGDTNTSNNLITVGASLVATGYNPYVAMKSSTHISVDSIDNSSSAIVKPTGISQIYNDLSKGKMQNLVNPNEMGSNIMQFSLSPYQISKNATESKVNQSLSIDQFPPGKSAEFVLSSKDPNVTYGNDTIVIPIYYVPENGTWSNQGCSVSAPNSTSQTLKANCSHLGKQKVTNVKEAFTLAIDVLKNVLSILRSGNYDMLYNFAAFNKVTTTNIIIYVVVLAIIILFVFAEVHLYRVDAIALYDARIKVLIQRYDPNYKQPSKGILFNVFNTLSQIRKKGIKEFAKQNQTDLNTAREATELNKEADKSQNLEIPIIPQVPNGFNVLYPIEEKALKGLFLMIEELRIELNFSTELIQELIFDIITEDCILARITQAALDDEIIKEEIGFWLLLRNHHPFVNALAKPDLTTPRVNKFFIVISLIIGQLFVTGYFFNPKDETTVGENQSKMVSDAALYSMAAVLLMIPLKIIISVFLVGKTLTENMTRDEIEKIEDSRALYRKLGLILGGLWLLGCFYAILMFSISFTEEALVKWIITFWTSFGVDLLIIQQLKILVTICFGLILMKVAQTKLMMTISGAIAGPLVTFIMNYF